MTQIRVEVVLATPERQKLIELELTEGATVDDAVEGSRILRYFRELDRESLKTGIWGREASGDQVLSTGDRVELYRPLDIDPKEARRQLALLGKTMREGAS